MNSIILKNLFKITLIGVTIVLASNSSCKKEDVAGIQNVEFNNTFDLALNKKALLGIESKELLVDFTKISDSRCPANVECVWAGNVTVSLNLSDLENNAKSDTDLCLGQCGMKFNLADTAVVNLNHNKYAIILKGVNPHPEFGKSETPIATLVIQKN